ncbi:MAG: hypothetical protein K6A69_08570, partial [Lachnospiraceae bacterium]|nr:hypothetical protein [Lachnospiraceae bacterium]
TGDAFNWEKSTDQFYKVMLAHLHFPNVFTPEDTKNVLRGAMSVANTPMRENDISPMDRYRFLYNLGCFLLYFHGDDESAIKYLKEAESGYKNVFSPSIKERIYEGLMWLNHFRGFDAVAAEYAKKYEEEAANTYEYCRYTGKTLEEAVEEPLYNRKEMLFELCCSRLLQNDVAGAKVLADRMEECPMCPKCQEGSCYEVLSARAMIALYEGELEKAFEMVEKINKDQAYGRNRDYIMILLRIADKTKV